MPYPKTRVLTHPQEASISCKLFIFLPNPINTANHFCSAMVGVNILGVIGEISNVVSTAEATLLRTA